MNPSVKIHAGCIACRFCEVSCPEVFYVEDEAQVIGSPETIARHQEACKVAEKGCPVQVIEIETSEPHPTH
ncbi:MAG: ferredoxin [Vampirovibrionales bacterium]